MADNEQNNTAGDTIRENIAGTIAQRFIDNKLTLLIILFSFLVGVLALLITPREENPQIVVPAANIMVAKPGASPEEVQELVIKPLESILQGMEGIDDTYGMAMESKGVVTVRFDVGEDKEESLVKLYDHVMSNMDRIPPGTDQPLIKPVDVDDVPIVNIALASDQRTDQELREIGLDVIEHLRRVEGASASFVHGGRSRAITVDLDLERMREYNVTLLDVSEVLEATNVDIPSGRLIRDNQTFQVHAGGMLEDAEAVADLVVALERHQPVHLRDIATVKDGPEEVDDYHRIGFGKAYADERPMDYELSAVTMALAKKSGTNAVFVADRILERLDEVRPKLIPEDVNVEVTRNDGRVANDAVNFLIEHLGIAIGSVVVLLVLFLGWRAAGIVTITIPLILFLTLAVGYVFGQTINRITLFALILALGLLVDDSIVVVENIYRHYSGKVRDYRQAAIDAVNEIGKPTNIATFTVVLALLPMFWVSGMMGPYMAPIPFFVPAAMLVSLLIAYTVAPYLAYRFLQTDNHEHGEVAVAGEGEHAEHGHKPGFLERGYAVLMRPILSRVWARLLFGIIVLGLMVVVLMMPAFDKVQFMMLPKNNTNNFNVTIDMPRGTALETTDAVVRRVADELRENPHVTTYQPTVGKGGVVDFNGLLRGSSLKEGDNVAEIRVNLVNKHHRDASSIEIVRDLRPQLDAIGEEMGANIKLVENPPGPPVRATILAEVYGPDYEKVQQIARELRTEVFETTDDVVDIDDSLAADTTEYDIVVNREQAALAGIMPAEVAETLHAFLDGYDSGTIHLPSAKEPVPIRVQIPRSARVDVDDLEKIFFTNPQGRQVPLTDIADIVERPAAQPIEHRNQRPVAYVTGEMGSTSQVYAVLRMWDYLNNNELPSGVELEQYFMASPDTTGYSVRWDGEMRLTLDVFRDLGTAFGVAVVLIYLVLVGYYGSFMIPMIVMGAIPLTIIGFFPGHWIMGQPFTATSMIGVIALAGVVVRNSLLLIDFILDNRRVGKPLFDSVLNAGVARLRAIMLTALALIIATSVILSDPVFGGLAISLMFGVFASTVLTLFVIPLLYYMFARHYEKKEERRAA
ncbi:MAG: efflux RND transporter permease subunit [Pseudomonadota bacterium]